MTDKHYKIIIAIGIVLFIVCLLYSVFVAVTEADAVSPTFETFRCYYQSADDSCYRMIDYEFGRVCYMIPGDIECFNVLVAADLEDEE